MVEVGNVVQSPFGAIGSVVDWTDHGKNVPGAEYIWDTASAQ